MKKIIAMILVLTMALSLAACGGSDKPYTSGLTLGSVYNHSYSILVSSVSCLRAGASTLTSRSLSCRATPRI